MQHFVCVLRKKLKFCRSSFFAQVQKWKGKGEKAAHAYKVSVLYVIMHMFLVSQWKEVRRFCVVFDMSWIFKKLQLK